MSEQQAITYYDGVTNDAVWVPDVYGYDSFAFQAFLKRGGILVAKDISVMPRIALDAYAKSKGMSTRAIGKLVDDNKQGTRIVMYDDGTARTATEERLQHSLHRIVVAPESSVYEYMVIHAKDHGLTVSWGGPNSTFDMDRFVIGFIKNADTSLSDLIKGDSQYLYNNIQVQAVIGESYDDIEESIRQRLDHMSTRLYDTQHKESVKSETEKADSVTNDSEDAPDDLSDESNGNEVTPDDRIAIISLDSEHHQIIGHILKPSGGEWDTRFNVTSVSLIDGKGHVLTENTLDNEYNWMSLPAKLIFDDTDAIVLDKAVTYRLNLKGQERAMYKLKTHDAMLPDTIDTNQYSALSDFMKDKYTVGEMREINDHADYRIIDKTTRPVDDIIANKPISKPLGLLIKEALGYKDGYGPEPKHNTVGSKMVHDSYRISELVSPYDGATSPNYSSDHRRRRTPVSYSPVYGSKQWTLKYDSEVWPRVYGRSYEELLEQARNVIACLDEQEDTTERSED